MQVLLCCRVEAPHVAVHGVTSVHVLQVQVPRSVVVGCVVVVGVVVVVPAMVVVVAGQAVTLISSRKSEFPPALQRLV